MRVMVPEELKADEGGSVSGGTSSSDAANLSSIPRPAVPHSRPASPSTQPEGICQSSQESEESVASGSGEGIFTGLNGRQRVSTVSTVSTPARNQEEDDKASSLTSQFRECGGDEEGKGKGVQQDAPTKGGLANTKARSMGGASSASMGSLAPPTLPQLAKYVDGGPRDGGSQGQSVHPRLVATMAGSAGPQTEEEVERVFEVCCILLIAWHMKH
ncbi:unnamed protein product [Choristocarpus tenellus]